MEPFVQMYINLLSWPVAVNDITQVWRADSILLILFADERIDLWNNCV